MLTGVIPLLVQALVSVSAICLPGDPESITTMAPVPATVGTWECFGLRSANFGAMGHV